MKLSCRLLFVLLVLLATLCASQAKMQVGKSSGIPAYTIPNFPFSKEEVDYSSGAAAVQMVLNYLIGAKVEQALIRDVVRWSPMFGVDTSDILRAFRFSPHSFPPSGPQTQYAGYPNIKNGLTAKDYPSGNAWYDVLKAAVSLNHPIIVRQYRTIPTNAELVYRVVYGFNTTHIFTADPSYGQYNRDIPNEDFTRLWNVSGTFWGVGAVPWAQQAQAIRSNDNWYDVQAFVVYDTPLPFTVGRAPPRANKITAEIIFDRDVWKLSPGVFQTLVVADTLDPDNTVLYNWKIECVNMFDRCINSPPAVYTRGTIQFEAPQTPRTSNTNFAPYIYRDVLGTKLTIVFIARV